MMSVLAPPPPERCPPGGAVFWSIVVSPFSMACFSSQCTVIEQRDCFGIYIKCGCIQDNHQEVDVEILEKLSVEGNNSFLLV